jgi:solute carrier family 25 protein 39/40
LIDAIALAVTPLEVVKIRQQASLPNEATHHSYQPVPIKKLETKSFLGGRGTAMPQNRLHPPRSSLPCLIATGNADSLKISVTGLNRYPRLYESTLCCAGAPTMYETKRGTNQMLKYILRSEGVTGLYTGLRPTLLMTVPNTAITLTLYEEIRSSTTSESLNVPVRATLLAGALSRCVASTVTLPLELIRTRQASFMLNNNSRSDKVPGLCDDLRYLVRTHGIAGLYKGLPVTLVRDSSFSGVYFVCLEWLRAVLKEFSGTSESHGQSVSHNLVSGAGAAAIATLLTGPLDTAKTRTQMIHIEGGCDVHSNHNMLRIIKDIYKNEGFTGLWKGNNARMIKVVPASAIMIASYEIGKDIIKTLFELP